MIASYDVRNEFKEKKNQHLRRIYKKYFWKMPLKMNIGEFGGRHEV